MSLGQKLVEARQKKALTDEQASMETCIPLAIIRSLETDDYSGFDSAIYAKNFLKTYSRFLDLNINQLLIKFDQQASGAETIFKANREQLEDTARPETAPRSRNPLFLAPVLVGVLAFLCVSLFSLFTGRSFLFEPPTQESGNPTPGATQTGDSPAADAVDTRKVTAETSRPGGITATSEGAYLEEFPSATTPTIFLKPSGNSGRASEVLP